MNINNEKSYIVSGDEEKTFISDVNFEHFYRINQQVSEVSFQNEIPTKMVQTGTRFFQYKNYSQEIDVGLYGFPYCLGSLITDSTVGEFPDYLRELSQFNRVFSECRSFSSSGIYDMEEQRLLFEGLRMADLGNVSIENKEISECCTQMSHLYEWSFQKQIPLVAIGGDHLLTYIIQSSLKELKQEDIILVIFDAHHDCKNTIFEKENVNHANFVKKLLEFDSIKKVIQIGGRGIRSVSNIVFHDKLIQYRGIQDMDKLKKELSFYQGCKLYLSIDLDVIDPAVYPSVDFIIPGGLSINELKAMLKLIFEEHLQLIGCDLVEGLPEEHHQYVQIPIRILAIILDFINQNQKHL